MADREELGVPAYLEARTQAEETVVRAAFDDLRTRVRADVKPPPARSLVARARRQQVRTARRRVVLAAAAAVVLLGGAATVVRMSTNDRGGSATVAASTPALRPTTPASPAAVVATSAPATTASTPLATRTVVVTVPPSPSRSKTRRPSATRTRTSAPPTAIPTSTGPSTEVTVYLWQGSLYPTCLNQYAVKRTVPGTGGWAAAVRASLAGATDAEKAAGYVSPFGAGVDAAVDEGSYTVDFATTAAINGVPPACRASLESLVTRTASDAGHGAEMRLNGSGLLWINWRIGLS